MKKTFITNQRISLSLLFLGFAFLNTHCKSESKLSGGVQAGAAPAADQVVNKVTPEPTPTPVVPTPTVPEVVPTPVVPVVPAVVPPVVDGAIQKGSFTVWTIPKDPKPYQDYAIFVQVALPANTKDYTIADLSGHLVGTDKYTQSFGGKIKPVSFTVADTSAVLQIKVPGSYFLVKDTIQVKSTLLDEEQEIAIVF